MPRLKLPPKCKHIAIEFLINPIEYDEHLDCDSFETVILPIAEYNGLIRQLLLEQKFEILDGKRSSVKGITAKEFYSALKRKNEISEKAIGYISMF
jgi:hypothetical protein